MGRFLEPHDFGVVDDGSAAVINGASDSYSDAQAMARGMDLMAQLLMQRGTITRGEAQRFMEGITTDLAYIEQRASELEESAEELLRVDILKSEIVTLTSQLAQARGEVDECAGEIFDVECRLFDMESARLVVEQQNYFTKEKLDGLRHQLGGLEAQLEVFQERVEGAEERMERYRDRAQRAERLHAIQGRETATIAGELGDARGIVDRLQQEVHALRAELDEVRQDRTELSQLLAETRVRAGSLSNQLAVAHHAQQATRADAAYVRQAGNVGASGIGESIERVWREALNTLYGREHGGSVYDAFFEAVQVLNGQRALPGAEAMWHVATGHLLLPRTKRFIARGSVHQTVRLAYLVQMGRHFDAIEVAAQRNVRFMGYELNVATGKLVRTASVKDVFADAASGRTLVEVKSGIFDGKLYRIIADLITRTKLPRGGIDVQSEYNVVLANSNLGEIQMAISLANQILKYREVIAKGGNYDDIEFHLTSRRPSDTFLDALRTVFTPQRVRIFWYRSLWDRTGTAMD